MNKQLKQQILVVAFGVTLFAVLMNLNDVAGFFRTFTGILSPIFSGLLLAFILSVPMLGIAPLTDFLKVLLITTQGRPTHLTCGQTIMRIIIPRPRSWRKGKLHPLFGQNASLKTNNWGHRPTNKWEAVCVRLVMALFPASLT